MLLHGLPELEHRNDSQLVPHPRIYKCIDSSAERTMFSTKDDTLEYCKIEIDERDRGITAATTHHAVFRFFTMSFGLQNDPATIKTAMDVIPVSP